MKTKKKKKPVNGKVLTIIIISALIVTAMVGMIIFYGLEIKAVKKEVIKNAQSTSNQKEEDQEKFEVKVTTKGPVKVIKVFEEVEVIKEVPVVKEVVKEVKVEKRVEVPVYIEASSKLPSKKEVSNFLEKTWRVGISREELMLSLRNQFKENDVVHSWEISPSVNYIIVFTKEGPFLVQGPNLVSPTD